MLGVEGADEDRGRRGDVDDSVDKTQVDTCKRHTAKIDSRSLKVISRNIP